MMKRNNSFLESKVNSLVKNKLASENLLVMNNVRLNPAEFDLVIFNPFTLSLINIEIKRNNWIKLYDQALRGKLYCHYTLILVPFSAKVSLDLNKYESEGIGVMFYKETDNDLELSLELKPKLSNVLNRNFKKLLYKQISKSFENLAYA